VVEDDFEQYVLNQSTRLLRTAYLLTGDQGRAEDLVQDSLVATYRQLSRIRDVCALDAYVRTKMGHTLVSWTRRPPTRTKAETRCGLRSVRYLIASARWSSCAIATI